ncbi:MAG: cysteine desulfurase-like protein [Candidatus Aminicenantes bacterium]|nr:cysteine desulfurase-like protein [Candidatus Aminicenantes bacterium]NIM77627.1 cysteine desulfurase-like protein [Candidatus Aminicenantes bacterium]NIN16939.1 cysteine desulfurase-like protein [Candidatus Aminicenantes bacterium]NIN40832.1 cysteine desulfurase-like protein [Candidatus Aminicenantes bacterium]NIN83636.1 cysteine desulfurase-like protein [Candidatus Aminicenantes bacterium]
MAVNMNIDFVRKQFPALSGEWVFLDNAGGSQALQTVSDRIRDYLLFSNVQLGATYDVSRVSTGRVDEAARTMAELINARDKCEVILGPSTSMLLKNISLSLVETFNAGDEIVVTNCDHEANIGPWRSLEKQGMVIKEWRINPETLDLHLEDLEPLMTEKTRLVALTHGSNILGTINPIKEIAAFIHERGAMICVDGVAYAPHALVDVQELNVDFYAFSFYKVYGPHYSLVYGKKSHLEKMPGINHFFLEDELPLRFQPGNVNYELSYGLLGVMDYFSEFAAVHGDGQPVKGVKEAAALTYKTLAGYEETLSARLLDFLNSKPNVRIIGKKEADRSVRFPTISFVVKDVKSSTIPPEVDKHKIGIRYGDFYARRLITDLGLAPQDGVVRVSMVHYNTREEIDRLIKIFETLF